MRQLTEDETQKVFEKLANYIGKNIKTLINKDHVFRLQKDRVYYVSKVIANYATSIARDNLMSLGICLGKFTKTGKFRLHITSLQILAPLAKYKVWIKPNGEMPFLYGNHILKAHLSKISDNVPEHVGIIVFNEKDIPLGFGVSSKSTNDIKNIDPTSIIVFRQSDIGEYLRDEDTLFA